MLSLLKKPQLFCQQNFLSVLLTSVASLDSSESSAWVARLEMITEIPSCSTFHVRSTISSAHSWKEFTCWRIFVPMWMINESGFRLTRGLMWSAISVVVQPGTLEPVVTKTRNGLQWPTMIYNDLQWPTMIYYDWTCSPCNELKWRF